MIGWVLIEALMWTVIVEVTLVRAEDGTGMTADRAPVPGHEC